MAKKLMSFRLAPDLAGFLVQQSEVLGVSTTELVNRLLRWAVQNVPEGFFQTVSLASNSGDLRVDKPPTREKISASTGSQQLLPNNNSITKVSPSLEDNPEVVGDYEQIEKVISKTIELKMKNFSNQIKEQLSNEITKQLSELREEDSNNPGFAEINGTGI
jgi:hypothetical protein